jgi:hypothetical protein
MKTAKRIKKKQPEKNPPLHPWRVCPYGEHSVVTHELHIRPSKAHPNGIVVPRHFHCAKNPSHKDQLYPNEINDIAEQHFSDLKNRPCPLPLRYGSVGSKYDDFIAGWTQYWNEVLDPTEPLDPNIVKALVATESSFIADKMANDKKPNSARGLTQITNDTRKTLDNVNGEIKDHYVTATREELNDPNVNICAGVRWLFHKQFLASNRLKRSASWPEAVYEYKGLSSKKVTKAEIDRIKRIFNESYET